MADLELRFEDLEISELRSLAKGLELLRFLAIPELHGQLADLTRPSELFSASSDQYGLAGDEARWLAVDLMASGGLETFNPNLRVTEIAPWSAARSATFGRLIEVLTQRSSVPASVVSVSRGSVIVHLRNLPGRMVNVVRTLANAPSPEHKRHMEGVTETEAFVRILKDIGYEGPMIRSLFEYGVHSLVEFKELAAKDLNRGRFDTTRRESVELLPLEPLSSGSVRNATVLDIEESGAVRLLLIPTFDEILLPHEMVGMRHHFLRVGDQVEVFLVDNEPYALMLPLRLQLEVVRVESAPAGTTEREGEIAVTQTGLGILVPQAAGVVPGDLIEIDTTSLKYLGKLET